MSMLAPPMPQQPLISPQDASQLDARMQVAPLLSEEEFSRLKDRVTASYAKLEPQREARLKAIKQYIGDSFGMSGADNQYESMVNMLDQMVEVYMQQLVSGNPRCQVLSQKIALKTSARDFAKAMNHVIEQINLRDSLKFAVMESLFSPLCVVKVGLESPDVTDRNHPFDVTAMPFVDAVFFEHWVHDTTVDRLELCRFYGDQYKEHREVLEADPRNDKSVLELMNSGENPGAFDTQSGRSVADLSGGQTAYENDDKDYVSLWDIYMPRKGIVVTYPSGGSEKPLRVVKWNGAPKGPYYFIRYKLVPGHILCKPPVFDVTALSDLLNKLWVKMGRQASRQKTIGVATLAATDDATKVIRTGDGDVISVTHPDAVKQLAFGGVPQETLTFAAVAKGEASYQGGNIDTMGGLGTQADTLGQEQMLQASSSGRIRARQQAVVEATKEILTAVGWYLWNDPLVRISVTDKIPGTDVELEVKWPVQKGVYGEEIDVRAGEYNDYNFDIEPYSMKDKSPGEQLALYRNVLQTDLLPLMQLLQAQGITIDIQAYLETVESLTDLTNLKDIIKFTNMPTSPDDQTVNDGGFKPSQSTRIYDRRPGGGSPGPDKGTAEMIASMPATKPTGTGA